MKQKIYKIFEPKITFQSFLDNIDIQKVLLEPDVKEALVKANKNYLHWEELRHKDWIPEKYFKNKELFWPLLRVTRALESTITPLLDINGLNFRMNTKNYSEFLHIIDKEMAGNFMGIPNLSENDKQQFVTRNIIEESIASSQLEGANTSRAVAKKMLIDGRKPNNPSEIMIVNNHKTMLKIEKELYKENLSWGLLCELHAMITDQTISEDKQGKLRETLNENDERLKVIPWADGTIAYIAPDKEFVEAELPRLIDFANDKKTPNEEFIHPLIKAIMLHFWIGLLHPFEDGNGRLARVLFYWYMLKHEYWAFKYLSLSEKIKKSSKQYAMAYIYSEQDKCDLTYFIHYNIEKLKLARRDFQEYIKSKVEENRSVNFLHKETYGFNERQIQLLHYFNQEVESYTNIVIYQKLYGVKKGTAIADLKELVEKGLLRKHKQGRNIYYYPTKQLTKITSVRAKTTYL